MLETANIGLAERFMASAATAIAAAILLVAPIYASALDQRPGRPQSPPASRDALPVSIDYLSARRAPMGLGNRDLEELAVSDRYRTERTGTTHLYLRQQVEGIDVLGGNVSLSIDAKGRVRSVGDRLIRGLRGRLSNRAPLLTAEQALREAAEQLGLQSTPPPQVESEEGGPSSAIVFSGSGLSRDPIPGHLVYVMGEKGGKLRLAWDLVIRTLDGRHWWNLQVDSETGQILRKRDWIKRDNYNVYPLPLMSPDEGTRSLVFNPADSIASPFGWHDTNGVAGAEFTDTRGNNVSAQDDVDADDSGGIRPNGGAGLAFDFPVDLTLQPGNYIDASVANLFYWNNIVHDVMYQYGFDEAAGNFQVNNYGNGGSGNDAVQADSQDGSDVGNAQFGTPPDGFEPRMEMFRWLQTPSPRFVVSNPFGIAGTYFAGRALFGAGSTGLVGSVVQAQDPADGFGPSTTDGCSSLTNAPAIAGNIAIIDRGTCFFIDKVANAQDAGAIAVIIVNNAGDAVLNMSGIDPTLRIPAIFLGQTDGATIVAQLGAGVLGNLVSPAARDSSFDAKVVVHEYGHGISNRLSGGPSIAGCMNAAESAAMGEGFGDWWALVLTAKPGDGAADLRGVAAYLLDEASSGGIRNFPYSVDLAQSPLTYADLPSLNQPHGGGEIWAAALWEMYWYLVYTGGYDPDLYAGTGGNNLALELVMDGLKLQACDPSMLDGRDAILSADAIANGGANECTIWAAFAKRGIGFGASDDGSSSSLSVTESFDVPLSCVPEPNAVLGLCAGSGLLCALARRRQRAGPTGIRESVSILPPREQ
jgi:extracellular elastinolytic metalloproteinase